jgi:hypothetical protein
MMAAAAALVCAGQAEAQNAPADFTLSRSFSSSYAEHGSTGFAYIPQLSLTPLQFVRSATLNYQLFATYTPSFGKANDPDAVVTGVFSGSTGFQLFTPDIISVSIPYSATLDCSNGCTPMVRSSGTLAIPEQELSSFSRNPYTIFTATGGIKTVSLTSPTSPVIINPSTDFGAFGASGTISYVIGTFLPEPAAWAMMIAGFGAIGTVLRRRSRPRPLTVS